ncbi:MAG: coenzyme F420-0:L-glutamate ligase [Candidatus Doudnabacteria bacterium]|nr:coenzyme F420-0:L-glutamate ligase [Candidatus Doudnabacteria bacterium]
MIVKPIKTRILKPPQDDLPQVIKSSIKKIPEHSVLVIASKVVSIWEGRCIPRNSIEKQKLIEQEADKFLVWSYPKHTRATHTLKNNLLIRSAGIDESNAHGFYILWPINAYKSARKIYDWIRKEYGAKNFGVIIVDSHSIPLRRGTFGISLGYFGFNPIYDYRGQKDLFGKRFRFTQANIVDGLAAAAKLAMGEGAEKTPLCLITKLDFVQFANKAFKPRKRYSSLEVPLSEDIFFPLIKNLPWKKNH